MSVWMHELRRPQVEAYLQRSDVVLLPIGSTEQHGRHLPLMTDAAQAIAVAQGVAERTGVLVAPPVWYGWSPFHLCYPGSFSLRPETLARLVEDILTSLIYTGFGRVIIISGHTTMNYIPVDPVALRMRQETGAYIALVDVGLIAKKEIAETLESEYDGHAGEMETAFMLYVHESLVNMDEARKNIPARDGELFPALIPGDPRIEGNGFQLYPTIDENFAETKAGEGSSGDPALASIEKGRFIYEAMVRNTILVVEAAIRHEVQIRNRKVPL